MFREGHHFEQMNYALDQGVNFWDTAELYAIQPKEKTYGKTEEVIGNWFKKIKKKRKSSFRIVKYSVS